MADSPDDLAGADTNSSAVQIASAKLQQNEEQQQEHQEEQNDKSTVVVSPPEVSPLSRLGIKKTDDDTRFALVSMVEQGQTVRDSAKILNLNLRTAYHILSQSQDDLEALRGVTRKVLAAQALDRIEDWRIAAEVGARKKGNHAPARDWLLHAGVIDNLQADGLGGIRIAINIGTDEKPMRIRSPLSIVEEE